MTLPCPHCKGTGEAPDSIAGRLLALRLSRGLTLREAEALTKGAISNSYMNQLETGKIKNPTATMLSALADLYGVTVDQLLGRAPPRQPAAGLAALPLEDFNEFGCKRRPRCAAPCGTRLCSK